MSFHGNNNGRRKMEKSNNLDSSLISINYVGIDFLFLMKIALSRIKVCRRVRFC